MMLFRRIVLSALLVGVATGLLLSTMQILAINPIIFQAETFEVAKPLDGNIHDQGEEAWAPADDHERTFYTISANIFAGIGFATILLAVMSQLCSQGLAQLNSVKGLLWGVAGFIVFFVAPSIGLPPEIPGAEAAPLEHRQLWWLLAVTGVGTGLLMLSYGSVKVKIAGAVAIVFPYLVGIPHHDGAVFTHPNPAVIEALSALHQQFIITSGVCNLLFWLALGGLSSWALNRWVLRDVEADVSAST